VAVNLGLLDDALYQVWRNGLVCLDADKLANLGFELPVDLITGLLPGFVPAPPSPTEPRCDAHHPRQRRYVPPP
jgi:hypothetical protein